MKKYEKYLVELEVLQQSDDYEFAHSRADDILVEILLDLGYDDIVDKYECVGKWYA